MIVPSCAQVWNYRVTAPECAPVQSEAMEEVRRKCEQLGREPRVWFRVPGYVVRNVTPDLVESVVHHMATQFAKDETFCSNSKLTEDPLSMKEATDWWRKIVSSQNLTVVALAEGSPGADLQPITVPRIPLAGANVLILSYKDDPPKPPLEEMFQGSAMRKAVGPFLSISAMVNCFSRYNVDVYMDAAGLSVHTDHRGHGLGDALLKARFEICRALGVKVTETVFTGIAAQKVALRCGFEAIKEVLYQDIKNKDGEIQFPKVPPTNKVLLTVKIID
ncbi:hypothetical protein B566_EDAN004358 [Ephemera danica]|nr:hypothetical protein B566_EDAN004358 [Ephemera danica]